MSPPTFHSIETCKALLNKHKFARNRKIRVESRRNWDANVAKLKRGFAGPQNGLTL
jgi:hypothetical protein